MIDVEICSKSPRGVSVMGRAVSGVSVATKSEIAANGKMAINKVCIGLAITIATLNTPMSQKVMEATL